ncbi:MAG TPA: Na+-dependent transporter [Alphaproteobacteria bacterium]|nr:Na+-dependent transporter [Alphaproteobacteria bacterium]
MNVLGLPLAALAWLGRQGTRAVAAIVFVAIAAPPVDAVLKPFVSEAIFILLAIAFMRVDTTALRRYVGQPWLVLATTGWTMLAVPAAFGAAAFAAGLDKQSPDLFLGFMLQGAAPPMMAAPAFAALMGFDATLVLVTLVAGTALTPLTAPLFSYLFVGPALAMSPLALGVRLFAILAGSGLLAFVIRSTAGTARIVRWKSELDGLNILIAYVFVAAVMENVAGRFAAAPVAMIGLAALAFVVSFVLFVVTAALFARAGREHAFTIAFMTTQRNMGLMLAAAGGVLPELAWIYFALCQFPIYLLPQLLKPLARRLTRAEKAAAA